MESQKKEINTYQIILLLNLYPVLVKLLILLQLNQGDILGSGSLMKTEPVKNFFEKMLIVLPGHQMVKELLMFGIFWMKKKGFV